MSFVPTRTGCRHNVPGERPCASDRHWGHWRWLQCLPQHRYCRAINLWVKLFGRYPRGVMIGEPTGLVLNFVRVTSKGE